MRTLFLAALTTSATIFATGVTPVAASEYRYCLQGDDYAGAGDRSQLESIGIACKATTTLAPATSNVRNAAVLTIPAKPHRR
jgi:hypothetical protein